MNMEIFDFERKSFWYWPLLLLFLIQLLTLYITLFVCQQNVGKPVYHQTYFPVNNYCFLDFLILVNLFEHYFSKFAGSSAWTPLLSLKQYIVFISSLIYDFTGSIKLIETNCENINLANTFHFTVFLLCFLVWFVCLLLVFYLCTFILFVFSLF